MGQEQSSTTDNAAEPNQDMEFEDLLRESLERRGFDDQLRAGLQQRLPADVVETVLQYACLARKVTRITRGDLQVHDGQVCHYVAFPLLPEAWMDDYSISSITFTATAHDQGWSSYPADHGTYRGSFTWTDISVRDMWPAEEGGERRVETFEMYRNLHARRVWQSHVLEAGPGHEIVQAARPGRLITIDVKALYPGWVHYINEASISISFLKARPLA